MFEHEILTIEEVARYLRVSERTIYDWAHRGAIPCGKIGTTWRFRRPEIEAWVNSKLGGAKPIQRTVFTGLVDALAPGGVLLTQCAGKAEVLEALLAVLEKSDAVGDPAELRRELLDRERIMSTGMGHSLGVPHVRLASVADLVMAVAVNDRPIDDYVALDDAPVRVVCMVAAHEDQHTQYLRTLSAVSAVVRDPVKNAALLAAVHAEEARALLLGTAQTVPVETAPCAGP